MYKILFFTTISIFSMLMIGCGGPAAPNGNGNKPPVNGPAANTNNFNPTPKPVAATTNDAPTLAPVVRAYYEALKKKDDAALKALLSKSLLKEVEDGMKEEKKTGLAAYMAETDRIPDKEIEVRNEKIDGDKGTAELKGGAYVNWSSISFVKEDGKWKLTNGGSEIEAVKPSGPAPKTGK